MTGAESMIDQYIKSKNIEIIFINTYPDINPNLSPVQDGSKEIIGLLKETNKALKIANTDADWVRTNIKFRLGSRSKDIAAG